VLTIPSKKHLFEAGSTDVLKNSSFSPSVVRERRALRDGTEDVAERPRKAQRLAVVVVGWGVNGRTKKNKHDTYLA